MGLRKNSKIALLGDVPLFDGCSKRELGEIALIADELELPKGQTVIREGAQGREFIVLVDGTARVTRRGRKVVDLGPGEWVGEIALVAEVPRTATVTALTPLRTLVVTKRDFRNLIEKHPTIAIKVLQTLGKRIGVDEST